MKTKVKPLRVGPCEVVQGCRCDGWEPHPTYTDVWQTCACGHSRGVHAIELPPEPARCVCCGQPLKKEIQ